MSEEEKKAIKSIKNLIYGVFDEIIIRDAEGYTPWNDYFEIVVNLIDKQQKEIEELENRIDLGLDFRNEEIDKYMQESYISKDKIRKIIGKYINVQEHLKYTNQELYGEDLKNMINELLEV